MDRCSVCGTQHRYLRSSSTQADHLAMDTEHFRMHTICRVMADSASRRHAVKHMHWRMTHRDLLSLADDAWRRCCSPTVCSAHAAKTAACRC